ncbi:MAG: Gfo/Idh/MocA family oxidoreductase [Acidobacteria bacterium]|nr:Gfo/Idh/MocA family oxidoreductase [Acidobacteriota bacterium]
MHSAIDRRSALLMTAAAARGSAANSNLSVGLIGAGGRGTFDATLLTKHTPARITAIADIDPTHIARAKKALDAPSAAEYKNFHDLLNSNIDAVLIATPVFLHPEHLEAAIKAGKHIYIEKPAGADIEGCKRVLKVADGADRRINITFGFQQRYGPGYRKAHTLVHSPSFGKLRFAHSHWIKGINTKGQEQPSERPRTEAEILKYWKDWRETFGDFIVETYCHGVDVLNWFLGGHPEKASGTGSQLIIKRGDQRDHCAVTFTYPGGVQANLTGSQIAPLWHRDVAERFYSENMVVETAREYWKLHKGREAPTEEREPRDITIDALSEFVKRVQDGRPENAGVSAAESTLTAILARTAMDLGREVTWKELIG